MKFVVSKKLIDSFEKMQKKDYSEFLKKTKEIRKLKKKDLLSSKYVVELDISEENDFYAYYIYKTFYIVFAFIDSKTLILLDIINLSKDNKIESLVYPLELTSDISHEPTSTK